MPTSASGSTRAPTNQELAPADLSTHLPALRAQLLEQRGFRVEQLRMLCLARARAGASRGSREIATSLQVGARSALRDVTNALQRMDEGTYGRCTRCHGAIPVERLEVLPQVAMCMPCQRAAELSAR
jgi:DnaK suppressor protein